MSNEPEVRKVVEERLKDLAEALEDKDIGKYTKLFAKMANIMVINPEEDTMLIGEPQVRQFAENFFKDIDNIAVKYGWVSVKNEEKVAWLTSHIYLKIKKKGFQEVELSAWLSAVLALEKDKWVFIMYHLSLPKTIEAPELSPEDKAAEEAAAKEAEAKAAAEKGTVTEGEEEKEPTEEDVFYEMP